MRRYAYIGIVVLLFALLAGCRARDTTEVPDSAEVPDSVTEPGTAPKPASVTLPDITQAPDLPKVSGTTEAPDSQKVPDTTGTTDSQKVPDTTEAPDSQKVPDTTGTTDSPKVPETIEAPDSGSTQTPGPRTLTADELRTWSQFLCRADCNGFLMSSYSTPLQADLLFVFYTGAGVGENPSVEMVTDYLEANDLDEAYTDITFIPYDKANQVLERRTGYTLEHFKLAGNDIPMYYSQKYEGYFHMAGDTNYMPVECVSGRENPDGSLSLEVRESSEWSGDSACSFETTLKPDTTGQTMLFDKNTVTGGWLTWEDE